MREYVREEKSRDGRGGMIWKLKRGEDVGNGGMKVMMGKGNRGKMVMNVKEDGMERVDSEFVGRGVKK